MMDVRNVWAFALLPALLAWLSLASVSLAKEQVVHTKTFFSQPSYLASGDVFDSYRTLEMPQGHIALRDLFAEVVDENGKPVPLYEVYLHHWVVFRIYVKKGFKELVSPTPKKIDVYVWSADPDRVVKGHERRMQFRDGADVNQDTRYGLGRYSSLKTFYAVGSETRRTDLSLPAPYGMETGNPAEIPDGYEEAWYLNLHGVDTRGAVDATRNAVVSGEVNDTQTESPLPEGYRGGMRCCRNWAHCAVKEGSASPSRKLFLKYTVTWVDMDETVIPVRKYLLDVTDPRTSLDEKSQFMTEYDIQVCSEGTPCIDHRHAIGNVARGGDLIQAVLHQHAGGMGGLLYDKDGNVLCQSNPIYGKGTEAGDEEGYVVGMTSCFPEPGSIYIEDLQLLKFDAYYSQEQARTGVMSLFNLFVADPVTYVKKVGS